MIEVVKQVRVVHPDGTYEVLVEGESIACRLGDVIEVGFIKKEVSDD